jgi:hypothetical protein
MNKGEEMKKTYIVIMSFIFSLLLSGCEEKVTKEEVVKGATAKSLSSIETDLKVEFEMKSNGQKNNSSTDISIKYIEEPFLTYMKMKTLEGDIELYLDNESAYILPPEETSWYKKSIDSVPGFAELAENNAFKEDLEKIKKFSEIFTFEQKEDEYILQVNLKESSGKKEKELVLDVLKDSMKNESFELSKINNFFYYIKLDKSYYVNQVKIKADIDLQFDGKPAQYIINVNADYKNINTVKAFSIPQDVRDKAIQQEQVEERYENSLQNNNAGIYPPVESAESYLAFQEEITDQADNVVKKLLDQISKAGSAEFSVLVSDSNYSIDYIIHKAFNTEVPVEFEEHRLALLDFLSFERSLLRYIQTYNSIGELDENKVEVMVSDINRAKDAMSAILTTTLDEDYINDESSIEGF